MKKRFLFWTLVLCAVFLISAVSPFERSNARAFHTKIVGGEEAVPGSWPWVAYLDITEPEDEFLCGGSLIDPQWILTAAHCTIDALSINVILGRHDISSDEGQVVPVEQWFEFPFYDDENVIADIALLKLAWPVDYPTIKVIGVDEPAEILSAGKTGMVVGWGNTVATDQGYPDTSDVLRQIELPIIDDDLAIQVMMDYAIEHWGEDEIVNTDEYKEIMREAMFFAGYLDEAKDSGQGDSGGPFMLKNDAGEWVLVGLVSWGFEDAAPGAYGAYTRVSTYDFWITDMVDGSRVYDYLEDSYPDIVGPERGQSGTMGLYDLPVHYRCYEANDACLVLTHGHLFYIGHLSNYEFLAAGTIADWLPLVEQ